MYIVVNTLVLINEVTLLWTGDCWQTGKPLRYVISLPDQLSLAIAPWIGAVSTSNSLDVNRHTARCTSPVSVVSQCKLVSA